MVAHSGLITVMQRAARKAAPRLRRDFGEVEQLQVSRKGPADFVSMADKRAEQTIVEELRNARPDWGMLLEEGGEIEGNPDKPRWIVDPLDGTTNFLHGVPHFSISIAVEEKKPGGGTEITQGLVYQPLTDESFWAEKGRGAWLQDARLRVSARRDLADSLIGTGIPHSRPRRRREMGEDLRGGRVRRSRASAASARPRSILPGSPPAEWTVSGKTTSTYGTRRRACCWSREAGGFVTDYRGADRAFERRRICRRLGGDPHQAAEARRGGASLIGLLALGRRGGRAAADHAHDRPEAPTRRGGRQRRHDHLGLEHPRSPNPRLPQRPAGLWRRLPAGLHPFAIAWDASRKRLWVAADCPPGVAGDQAVRSRRADRA